MKITPLDIQQQRFRQQFRGYDTKEVDTFLEMLANELAEATREANLLRDELRLKEQELAQYRDRERSIQETLHMAQRVREESQETGRKEAELIIRQAEQEADKLLTAGHLRLSKVLDEITTLKAQRIGLEEDIRGTALRHLKLLDVERDGRPGDSPELEDKLRLFRRADAGGKPQPGGS